MRVIEKQIAIEDLERHIRKLRSASSTLSMDTERDLIDEIDKKIVNLYSAQNVLLCSDLNGNEIKSLRTMLYWFNKNKKKLEELIAVDIKTYPQVFEVKPDNKEKK